MKKFFTFFLTVTLLLLLSGNYLKAQTYCTTGLYTDGCIYDDYFTDFSFGTISQTGLTCSGSTVGYNDFTALTTSFTPGSVYPISGITAYGSGENVRIWIDYNNDGTFDNVTEVIYASPASFGTLTDNVTIPLTATPGTHRMRVRVVYGASGFDACTSQADGCVNDYTATVVALSTPYFTTSIGSYNFNYVAFGNNSAFQQFDITGSNLLPSSGNITITAPAGFQVSLASASGYLSSVSIPYSGGSFLTTPIYVKFVPLAPNTSYSANLTLSGGGASSNISLSGTSQLIYCTSNATSTADEELLNVTLGSLNNSSICGDVAPGAGSISSEYSNYTTSVSAPNLIASLSYPLSVEVGTCGGNYTNFVGVWIDYNQDGIFDATEQVYASAAGTSGPHIETATITIPAGAILGSTRMRVIAKESSAPTPCGTYSWGETEDYTINIVAPSAPYFVTSPGSHNYSYVAYGSTSTPFQFDISGNMLTGAPGNVTVTAPNGFEVSLTSGSGYSSSVNLAYASPTLSITPVFVRFVPAAPNTAYSANLLISGGGATSTIGLSGTSQLIYCNSSATNTADEELVRVAIGGMDNAAPCSTLATGPGSAASLYSNYTTSVTPPNLIATLTYPLTVEVALCNGNNYNNMVGAWIDYNQNGIWDSIQYNGVWYNENVFKSATNTYGPQTVTANVTIPPNAHSGLTRMRVVSIETTLATAVQPCGTYGYGETEDYMVNIIPALPCFAPTNQPTAAVFTPDYLYMTGSFTASPDADHYLIIRSTASSLSALPIDGTVYTSGANFGGGMIVAYQSSTNFTDLNLNSATQYYYFVFAVNSNCIGGPMYLTINPLIQSVNTKTPAQIHSVASGYWEDPTTWNTGTLPDGFSTVYIDSSYTVHLSANTDSCFNLIVNTHGVLDASGTGGVLNLQNGITNDGTINLAQDTVNFAILKFWGQYSATYSGSGINNIYQLSLNKNFSGHVKTTSPTLEVNLANLTVRNSNVDTTGFIPAAFNGIYKFSGTFNLANRLFQSAAYTIPSSGGIWLNNPNFTIVGQNGDAQMTGLLHISQGTFKIGQAINNTMYLNAASLFYMDGGAINSTGRIYNSTAGTFDMSNGTMTVGTIGNTNGTGEFEYGLVTPVLFSMSGGTIVVQNANTGSSPIDIRFPSPGISNVSITGGTVKFGNNLTQITPQSFMMDGVFWDVLVDTTTAQHGTRMYAATNILHNFTNPGIGIFNLGNGTSGQTLKLYGNLTNKGMFNGNVSTLSTVQFLGVTNQVVTLGANSQMANILLNNTANVNVGSLIVNYGLTLTNGSLISSGILTFGDATANTFNLVKSHGNVIGTTAFNFTNMTAVNYTYNDTISQTTGIEIPSAINGTLTINNAKGLTLSKKLATANLTMTNGMLNTSTTNILSVTNTSSSAISGTFSTTRFVNGPIARAFPAGAVTVGSWIFPVGTMGADTSYNPYTIINPTAGVNIPYVKVSVSKGTYTGTPGTFMLAVNTDRRWNVTVDSGNFTYSRVQVMDTSANNKLLGKSATINGTFNGMQCTQSGFNITSIDSTITLLNYFALGTKNPMAYISSTTTQTNISLVSPGTTKQQIIGFQVVTLGNATPLVLSQINFNANGTSSVLNDITNIRLFSTGTSSTFATTSVIDSTANFASGTFSLNPSTVYPFYLSEGTNYFWLTYDINPNATNNDLVDAQCLSITVDGIPRIPTITSPIGNRTIFPNPIQTIFAENFDGTWTTPGTLSPTWNGTSSPANNQWQKCNYTTGWSGSSGAYSPTGALSTTGSARFHSYDASSGTSGDFISPTFSCAGNAGSKSLDFYYINTSGTDVLKVYLSTDNGTTWGSALITNGVQSSWVKYTVSLGNITSSTCKLKFTATSDYGTTDIGIDQLSVYSIGTYPNMQFYSTTSTQPSTSPVIAASTNQQVLQIQIATLYPTNPLTVNSLTLSTNGSTNALSDLDSAKVYFTGTSNIFATTNLFGSVANPNGTFTITGSQALTGTQNLTADVNYFWLVYNIKNNPVSYDSVDGEYNLLSLSSSPYSPDVQAPIGKRVVRSFLNGIYTIDSSQNNIGTNYKTFAAAINDLNLVGINGPVTFNVKANQSWPITIASSTSPNNYAYKITTTGTAVNPIVFQRSGTGANPVLNITGTSSASATTGDKGVWLNGCDYITFNGIDVTDAGTTTSNFLDYGFYFSGASTTDGCVNNLVQNCKVTLHRNNPYAFGIFVDGSVNTAGTAPNKYNKFYNNYILNANNGYRFNGYSYTTFGQRDLANEIGTINGGRSLINATGINTNTTSAGVGIYAAYQDSLKVFNTMIDTVHSAYTSYPVAAGMYIYYNSNANIYNDTIRKVTQFGAADALGINFENQSGVNNIYNNIIDQIAANGSSGNLNIMRLYSTYTLTGVTTNLFNVYNNTITNCSTKGTGSLEGIYLGSLSTSGMIVNCYNNKIAGINSTSSTSNTNIAEAIYCNSVPASINIYNNMISDITDPYSTGTPSARGIYLTTTAPVRVFNNTVYLDSTNTQATANTSFNSACIYAASGTPVDMRNNIFVNKNTVTYGTRTMAFWYGSTTYSTFTSNNNLFYSGSPSAKKLIFWDGTNKDTTLISYQTRMGGLKDQQSSTGEVPFVNGTVKPYDLHINTTISSSVESHGQRITSPIAIATDIDGQTRWGETGYTGNGILPDLGADEFNGVTIDNIAPILTYTALGNTASLAGVNFNNVNITDPMTGVNTTTSKPRVYFKKPSMSNDITGWKYVEPTNSSSPFNFYLDFSLLGTTVNVTDTIQYFIIAQDNAPTPNFAKTAVFNGTLTSTNLLAANFPVTLPSIFKVMNPVNGNYNVGIGQQFTTLTNDSVTGFFKFLNNNVVTGNVTVNITSNIQYEAGTVALGSYTSEGAGGYTITIKPVDATLKVISGSYAGALIRNTGASNVIFNGSYNGTGRYLRIRNYSTSGNGFQFTTGANSCSVKNCYIRGASNSTSTLYGVYISSGGVNNLTIDNNVVENFYYGLYATGTSSLFITNLVVSNNTFGSDSNAVTLGNQGVYLTYCNGANIFLNNIKNIRYTYYSTGINLNTSAININVYQNTIHDLYYVGTIGYGSRGIDINTGIAASNINIFNNVLYNILGDGDQSESYEVRGIGLLGTTGGVKLYNNSINLSGSAIANGAGTYTSYSNALYMSSGVTSVDVRDNIIVNTIYKSNVAASKAYGIYCAAPVSSLITIDYNIYYVSGTQGVMGYLGADINNIAAWRTATLQDAHSMFVDPVYTSNTNLIPSKCPTSPAIVAGTPLASVPTDILNVSRSATPTIGAYELGYAKTMNVSAKMQEYYTGAGLPMNQTWDMDMNTYDMFTKYQAPIVDLVQLAIMNPATMDPFDISGTAEYLYDNMELNQDGTITPSISLPSGMTGKRFIVLTHRNSIQTWSDSVDFACLSVDYNFYTHPISTLFPNNMLVDSAAGVYHGSLIFGGDIDDPANYLFRDGVVNIFDLSSVFDAINDPTGLASAGYVPNDLTGDGVVDIFDLSLVFDNLNRGAASVNPGTLKKKK